MTFAPGSGGKKIRALLVRDEMRATDPLLETLDSSEEFEVIGPVGSGRTALDFVRRHHPDVIVLETDRLASGGLETIEAVMAERPTPILLETDGPGEPRSRAATEAIRAGALDFLVVPPEARRSSSERKRILDGIRFLAGTPVVRHVEATRKARAGVDSFVAREPQPIELVAFAASTGGPAALATIFTGLPRDFPAAIVIVQHLESGYVSTLADWLAEVSRLPVKLAATGDRLARGTVFLAPDQNHLLVERGGRLALSQQPPVDGHRPSCNLLLSSVAKSYGPLALGVVLTGMGNDGTRGLLELRQAGGRTLAQDEASCQVFGMPKEAWEAGAAEQLVPLRELAPLINRWVARKAVVS